MNRQKQLEQLQQELTNLGFNDEWETSLCYYLCFRAESFVLPFTIHREDDVLLVQAQLQRDSTSGFYRCLYYDATLRKAIPAENMDALLMERMARVPWSRLREPCCMNAALMEEVGAIVDMLQDMEDQVAAGQLRARFWIDTPAQEYFYERSVVRTEWEVSQRFFFFDDEPAITIEEAYRFLNHKWLERRMQRMRKEEAGAVVVAPPATGGRTGKKAKRRKLAV